MGNPSAEQRRGIPKRFDARSAALLLALMIGLVPTHLSAGDATVAEPSGYRLDQYRAPVPATLAGARVIDAEAARTLLVSKSAIFIDVFPRPFKPPNLPPETLWRDPPHESIEGSVWLPNVGYGVLAPAVEQYFKDQLARLTGGDTRKPLVIFCQRDCWMSWNAAKRALAWGYANVLWFPDGTDAWLELGESLVTVAPRG